MIELSLSLAAPIAKAILEKFYEGFGSKLGEKAVELLPEKVKQLGQWGWQKLLRGTPETEALVRKAEQGSAVDQHNLTQYLHRMLDANLALRQEAQQLAEEIQLQINADFGSMTQNNRDMSTGYQTQTGPSNTNFFGGTHHHG